MRRSHGRGGETQRAPNALPGLDPGEIGDGEGLAGPVPGDQEVSLALLLPRPLPANELVWHALVPPAGVTAGGVAELVADVANAGVDPWGEAHFLIARDLAGQVLAVADLAGIEPGQRVRRTLRFPATPVGPALTLIVQALEPDVARFGEPRRVSFAVQPRPPFVGRQLSATSFDALAP
ncbi:MAG: hypothetical protein ACKOUK_05255, partial [Verrucomicrobiota bacterium]